MAWSDILAKLTAPPYRYELYGSGGLKYNRDSGVTGTRIFLTLGNPDMRLTSCPNFGDPHPQEPLARVCEVSFDNLENSTTWYTAGFPPELPKAGYNFYVIKVLYSSNYLHVGDLPILSIRLSNRAFQIGVGRTYTSTGKLSNADQTWLYSTIEYNYRYRILDADIFTVTDRAASLMNTVNNAEFMGVATGKLMYTGFEASPQWEFRDYGFQRTWLIDETLQYFELNWNSVWNPEDGGYWDTFVQPMYASADFSILPYPSWG